MKDLIRRSISGIVFVILILIAISLNEFTLFLLLSFLLFLGLKEFYILIGKIGHTPVNLAGMLAGFIFLATALLTSSGRLSLKAFFPALLLVFLIIFILLFKSPVIEKRTPDQFCKNPSCHKLSSKAPFLSTLFGVLYVALPLSLFPFIAFLSGKYSPDILFGFFIILWTYDSFAYLAGVSMGKHKIYPEISPAKSWEGFAGGLIFAVLASILSARIFPILSLGQWIAISLIIVTSGTLGDFFESSLKRKAGIKDSGSIIPGHGGILDRLDSVLFSIPVIFIYLSFLFYIR